ncbi:MAG: alpha-L-arabinofuranosidase C-terminal domain-containing protein, partial [Planctomycetota bacterium]
AAMLAAPVLIAQNLADLSRQIDSLAPDRGAQIKIAVTEWGPLFSGEPGHRFVDHVKTVGSALLAASAMKAFLESPRTEVACLFTLVDNAFLGWIGLRQGKFLPKAPYLALQMYTRHFGSTLVRSSATSPTYDSAPVGVVEGVRGVPYLDVVASRSDDGRTLYLMAINRNFDRPIRTSIELQSFIPSKDGIAWTLTGTGIDANTGTELPFPEVMKWARQAEGESAARFYQGKPEEVQIVSAALGGVAPTFEYTFPPHSVTSLELAAAGATLSRLPARSKGADRSKGPTSPR